MLNIVVKPLIFAFTFGLITAAMPNSARADAPATIMPNRFDAWRAEIRLSPGMSFSSAMLAGADLQLGVTLPILFERVHARASVGVGSYAQPGTTQDKGGFIDVFVGGGLDYVLPL